MSTRDTSTDRDRKSRREHRHESAGKNSDGDSTRKARSRSRSKNGRSDDRPSSRPRGSSTEGRSDTGNEHRHSYTPHDQLLTKEHFVGYRFEDPELYKSYIESVKKLKSKKNPMTVKADEEKGEVAIELPLGTELGYGGVPVLWSQLFDIVKELKKTDTNNSIKEMENEYGLHYKDWIKGRRSNNYVRR
jgi:hypothetical protein